MRKAVNVFILSYGVEGVIEMLLGNFQGSVEEISAFVSPSEARVE